MARPRFFIDLPDEMLDAAQAKGTPVALPPKAAHHAGRTLRLASGEPVALFNGRGRLWTGEIVFPEGAASVLVRASERPATESPVAMTLLQSWVSPEKMDWIVEKATEAGVSRIVLSPAERSVTKLSGERLEKRVAKLFETARAAAEQCGRNVIPTLESHPSLEAALSRTEADLRLMLAPGVSPDQPRPGVAPGLASCAFAVGPEGGFSPSEIALAESLGWHPTLLGPRVLRTETAGLACAVWMQTLAGDFPRD